MSFVCFQETEKCRASLWLLCKLVCSAPTTQTWIVKIKTTKNLCSKLSHTFKKCYSSENFNIDVANIFHGLKRVLQCIVVIDTNNTNKTRLQYALTWLGFDWKNSTCHLEALTVKLCTIECQHHFHTGKYSVQVTNLKRLASGTCRRKS